MVAEKCIEKVRKQCVLLRSAALAGFEEYMTALAPEGGKKSRAKAFRIPGLGKRDKEPDST